MLGFFTTKEIQEASEGMINKAPEGDLCNECGLFRKCRSPKMPYTGKGKRKILIIAEAPGEQEDKLNIQLVGEVGQFFRQKLKECYIDLEEDCWKINSANCRPSDEKGANREPTNQEIDCCRPYVYSVIDELQPTDILVMGESACRCMFGQIFKDTSIGRWRGLKIPSRRFNAFLYPLYHPSFPMRNVKDDLLQSFYMLDLKRAIESCHETRPEFYDYKSHVENIFSFESVMSLLNRIETYGVDNLFHDYETSGLKPYQEGHKIVSVSCAFEEDDKIKAYAFPYDYRHHFDKIQKMAIKKRWRQIMQSDIPKTSHNLKYEKVWTYVIFGVETNNGHWCTMDTAHVIDDRKKFTSLNFQSYINFGIEPYDSYIDPYKKALKGEKFNRMEEADLDLLLDYGGLDSKIGYMLWDLQKRITQSPGLERAREFFNRASSSLTKMTLHGVRSDLNYYETTGKEIDKEIADLKNRIITSKEAEFFKRRSGKELKIGKNVSDKDLRTLLYDYLQFEPIKTTESEQTSVDKEAIIGIDLPFVKDNIKLRELNKTKGTYFDQFIRETCSDKIHTWFNLHIPRSFRSSSDSPNLHNIPVRDELAKKLCRSGIYPSPGRFFLFGDVKAGEVCVAAMYSKDPNLVYYIKTPGTDMHRDQSEVIWDISESEVAKEIRFYTKNCFVFPEFYGDYYGNCAKALWKNCIALKTSSGVVLKDHLIKIGIIPKDNQIQQFRSFENHMKQVEEKFWHKFGNLREWQKEIIAEYKKTGFVRLKHGFRRGGYLKKNEIGNTPIQGTLFHLVLELLIYVDEMCAKNKWESNLALQIHDEIIPDCVPSEYKQIRQTMENCVSKILPERFDWINVPLTLEFEASPVNHSWYHKTEIDSEGYFTKKGTPFFGQRLEGVI